MKSDNCRKMRSHYLRVVLPKNIKKNKKTLENPKKKSIKISLILKASNTYPLLAQRNHVL